MLSLFYKVDGGIFSFLLFLLSSFLLFILQEGAFTFLNYSDWSTVWNYIIKLNYIIVVGSHTPIRYILSNTPYGKDIEHYVPQKEKVIESFKRLSSRVGSEKTGWRYDPIFIASKYTLESHIESFERMSSEMSGYTQDCVISFIDLYEKTKHNFPGVREVTKEEQYEAAQSKLALLNWWEYEGGCIKGG